MNIKEFEKLTSFHPTADLYKAIEHAYMEFDGDKTEFCNLNNSKKNFAVFGQTDNYDDDTIVIEVANNTGDPCRFKSADLSTETWDGKTNFEFRYLSDTVKQAEAVALWQKVLDFVVACDPEKATSKALSAAVEYDGVSYNLDTTAYRKAKFKAEAGNYFVMDSVIYHKLYTLVFCLPDNRAKNTFWGYSKRLGKWHLCFSYDHDTAMGNDNEGGLTLRYGYLDTDTIGTKNVFNAADSVLFKLIDDVFAEEMRDMFIELENEGAETVRLPILFCSADNWWLRSPNATNTTNFSNVNNNGNVNSNNATNTNGVAFGSCTQIRLSNPEGRKPSPCRRSAKPSRKGKYLPRCDRSDASCMGSTSTGSEEQAPAKGTLYRVQCGAFSVKANADKLAAQLKAKGFDTYIVVIGSLYKVQTGAYSVKANADAQLKKVKAAGFDAFITTEAGKAATSGTTAKPATIAVGDKVKCNAGVTKFSNGAKMASWVPAATLYVRQIESGGKILLVSTEKTKAVYTGRVNASDVHKI